MRIATSQSSIATSVHTLSSSHVAMRGRAVVTAEGLRARVVVVALVRDACRAALCLGSPFQVHGERTVEHAKAIVQASHDVALIAFVTGGEIVACGASVLLPVFERSTGADGDEHQEKTTEAHRVGVARW
jgi:hypothetical protein